MIGVDRLPQQAVQRARQCSCPVALHGVVAGGSTRRDQVPGQGGAEGAWSRSRPNGSAASCGPSFISTSPKKLQIAWAWATPALSGDRRLEATLPEDGTYTVTLHDAEYAAAAPASSA